MSKLKIERGASKMLWVLLKTNIEDSIAADLDLMCKWSDNDRKYVVNELLRFALTQSGEFQQYKSELQFVSSGTADDQGRPGASSKIVPDSSSKPAGISSVATGRE